MAISRGFRVNFGVARAFGSLSFALVGGVSPPGGPDDLPGVESGPAAVRDADSVPLDDGCPPAAAQAGRRRAAQSFSRWSQ
ncbi:MAG: hypothetical protein R2722_05035 [Tessaracoccus sp.]